MLFDSWANEVDTHTHIQACLKTIAKEGAWGKVNGADKFRTQNQRK